MKLLDIPELSQLSAHLSGQTAHSRIICRIEAYSCKMIGEEKKTYKQMSQAAESDQDMELLSPSPNIVPEWQNSPNAGTPTSASGMPPCLLHICPRKVLFNLKSTLNAAFYPDYDFSSAKSHEFTREPSFDWVQRAVNGHLAAAQPQKFPAVSTQLWQIIKQEIGKTIEDVELYSYTPDLDSDPFGADGALWSFNYFLYNRKLRRILFFTCRALSPTAPYQDDEEPDNEADDTFVSQEYRGPSSSDDDMDAWDGVDTSAMEM